MTSEALKKITRREPVATSQLVELLASNNPEVKILTADYVAHMHSTSGWEDLGLLVTNLLSRDCHDANPAVAGSAVSALAVLQTAQEEALAAILHCLDSPHAKVRQCAAAASLSYSKTHPDVVVSCGLSDRLYSSLRDRDPVVVARCLVALDHILASEGGVVINKSIAHYLLFKRLNDFSDATLETVLKFLRKYNPKDDKERFEMLNPLDTCFQSDYPPVLVAASNLFFQWTSPYPHLRAELVKVIQPAFCKIFLKLTSAETNIMLTNFFKSLGSCTREIFNKHYKDFFIKPSDPNHLKKSKFEIMCLIALPINASEFIENVYPYCSDFNCYADAISCLGGLGQLCTRSRENVLGLLSDLLVSSSVDIVASSLDCLLRVVSCNMLFPESLKNRSTSSVLSQLANPDEPEPLANQTFENVWPRDLSLSITLKNAISQALSRPAILECHPCLVLYVVSTLATVFEDCSITCLEALQAEQHRLPPTAQCLLLTTVARVFLCRPAQCYHMLVRVLRSGVVSSSEEVRDKAFLLYAMLKLGPNAANQLLCGTAQET
ncbi:AP-4 complex subunit beta-1 [Hyalella azteca]|uniref:AP-4 complex subunit beta-1 n=1 Tax=Hyalella azteca TaxID=294128 RepID=A0A8B7N372_HYAAZ|nr:AP-4 complex subunit beta-1 [Hyalella azteca]